MSTLTRRIIRLALDATSFEPPKDQNTAATPALWRGNAARVEFAIFQNGALVSDLSNIDSVLLEVKATRTSETNLISPTELTQLDLDDSITLSQWTAKTHAHGAFLITGAQTNIDLGGADYKDFWLVISALTDEPQPITLGATSIRIYEDGAGFDAGDPDENPGATISADWVVRNFPRVLPGIIGLTGGGLTKLDGIGQSTMTPEQMVMLPKCGDALFWRATRRLIVSSSAANPTTVTMEEDHNLTTGDIVAIGGHGVAALNGATVTVTVTGAKTFTVPVLGGGAGGYVTPTENAALGIIRPDDFAANVGVHWRSEG